MQVKNLRAFDIYLPYAGLKNKSGWKLSGNGLSPDLPTDRFYDPLLQRDWHKGNIQLVFNKLDVAALGPAVVAMFDNAIVPADTSVPGPVAVAGQQNMTQTVEASHPVEAKPVKAEPNVSKHTAEPSLVINPQIAIPAETPLDGKAHCPLCGKARDSLTVYPPMTVPVCKFCFRSRSKKDNWSDALLPQGYEVAPTPVVQAQRPIEELVDTGAPGISLADLNKENMQRASQLLGGPMGSPMQSMDRMALARNASA